MQHFKLVNWRIRGFVFWCHEQVIYCCFLVTWEPSSNRRIKLFYNTKFDLYILIIKKTNLSNLPQWIDITDLHTFIVVFSVSWEPSSNRRIKQVSGHLYATLLDKLRPFTQYKARIKATNDLGEGNPSNVIAVRYLVRESRDACNQFWILKPLKVS